MAIFFFFNYWATLESFKYGQSTKNKPNNNNNNNNQPFNFVFMMVAMAESVYLQLLSVMAPEKKLSGFDT